MGVTSKVADGVSSKVAEGVTSKVAEEARRRGSPPPWRCGGSCKSCRGDVVRQVEFQQIERRRKLSRQ